MVPFGYHQHGHHPESAWRALHAPVLCCAGATVRVGLSLAIGKKSLTAQFGGSTRWRLADLIKHERILKTCFAFCLNPTA
jgi:hypothetical protein